jgi:hypothetical protein
MLAEGTVLLEQFPTCTFRLGGAMPPIKAERPEDDSTAR